MTETDQILDTAYALAVSPNYAQDGLCFVARRSGLYRSTDGGQSWEDAYAPLSLAAPGAYFSRMSWTEESPGSAASLVVHARVGGRGDWTMPSGRSKDILHFEKRGNGNKGHLLDRQGDRLELRVYTRYAPWAFDPVDFSSNGWKYAPILRRIGVEYAQPTLVLRHEEWR